MPTAAAAAASSIIHRRQRKHCERCHTLVSIRLAHIGDFNQYQIDNFYSPYSW